MAWLHDFIVYADEPELAQLRRVIAGEPTLGPRVQFLSVRDLVRDWPRDGTRPPDWLRRAPVIVDTQTKLAETTFAGVRKRLEALLPKATMDEVLPNAQPMSLGGGGARGVAMPRGAMVSSFAEEDPKSSPAPAARPGASEREVKAAEAASELERFMERRKQQDDAIRRAAGGAGPPPPE